MQRAVLMVVILAAAMAIAGASSQPLLWPLPSSRVVTGGFADTRPDHFHGGVDLRARTPEAVVAPADGWVERLSVNPWGYGHALYFRLDDGRTAVFGHLSSFAPAIEQALRDSQLVHGTAHVEIIYSEPRVEMTYARGATIAYTGKTGSGPAHLHFEIREGAVQTDPLANFDPTDTAKPVITGLWWTTRSDCSPASTGSRLKAPVSGNRWLTPSRHGIESSEPVAFFVQAYDPGPWGRNALPSIFRIRVNGEIVHEVFPGRIDLAEPKSFYGDIVWAMRRRGRTDERRLFLEPPPVRYTFTPIASEGWLSNLKDATVTIEVVDRAGNTTTADIPVTCGAADSAALAPPNSLTSGDFTLSGDTPTLAWAALSESSASEVVISPGSLTFARPCTLSYRYPPGERTGLYLYQVVASAARRPLWTLAEPDSSGTLSCTVLRAGTYGAARDTTPPGISVTVLRGRIRYRVGDGESWVDDSTIRCTIDGATAIPEFEYDVSGGYIWTPQPLSRGPHEVTMTAGDRAGNVTSRTWTVRIR